MKTVFISAFHSIISRNILNSGILDLLAKEYKIVLLVPDYKKIYFDKYKSDRVSIEGIPQVTTRRDLLFRKISLWLLPTKTIFLKEKSRLASEKSYISFIIYRIISISLTRWAFVNGLFRKIDYFIPDRRLFDTLIEIYKPDLIFSTDIQSELDVILLKSSKRLRKKYIGMIRSWDNVTSKGVLRFVPDKIIVNSEITKNELQKYDFISPESIFVVGVPHYDRYLSFPFESKDHFFKSCGFDQSKKVILYTPIGDRYIFPNSIDEYVIKELASIGENLIVRLPPADTVMSILGQDFGKNVFLEHTGVRSWKAISGKEGSKVNEISSRDDDRLITTLRHSDVVVSGPSTILIDAVLFDKPVVMVDFEVPQNTDYYQGVKRYYDYEHFDFIRSSKGVKFADSPKSLTTIISSYLKDKTIDTISRKEIALAETYRLDSKSTQRLYEVLKNCL